MSLAEFNWFICGVEKRSRQAVTDSILTGYYTAYYVNGGKKARPPKELIESLYGGSKETYAEGVRAVERLRALDAGEMIQSKE